MKTITLTKGKVAIVDDKDFESLSRYKWTCTSGGYAARWVGRTSKPMFASMHRQILGILHSPDKECDHINGNRLDNRRVNIRVCSHSENMCNRKPMKNCTSGTPGVHWSEYRSKWAAKVKRFGKYVYEGYFDTKEEAIAARNAAARKHHGAFAVI